VEPVSLTIGAMVAALVLKGAETTGERVTEGGLAAIGRLVDRVRGHFRDRSDAAAEKALARVEDPPAGPPQLAALAAAVDRRAGDDAMFADEMHRLVREAEAAGVEVRGINQVVREGSHNLLVGTMTGSTVNVNSSREVEFCGKAGCGIQAWARCANERCLKLCCQRHIVIAQRQWRSILQYHDDRIADLATQPLEVIDRSKVHDIWNEDPRTLCVDCRNEHLLTRRNEFVSSVELPLPEPDGDAVVYLRTLSSYDDASVLRDFLHRRIGDRFAQVGSEVARLIQQRRMELEPAIRALGPDGFAVAWANAERRAGRRPIHLPTGWLSGQNGYPMALNLYVTAEGLWLEPVRFSMSRVSHQGVSVTSRRPLRWKIVPIDPDHWAEIVHRLTHDYWKKLMETGWTTVEG
jgi:hypothetical protein